MKYVAYVQGSLNRTVHGIGEFKTDGLEFFEINKIPDKLTIFAKDEGYYLYYINSDDIVISDTWHQSLDEAMEQAAFEFGLGKAAWKLVD